MRSARIAIFVVVLAALTVAQQKHDGKSPVNAVVQLPKASLWSHYSFQFQPTGDNGPYRWRPMNGILPHGLRLEDNGKLSGEINKPQETSFAVIEIDRTGKEEVQRYAFVTETPLTASWDKRAQVAGNRIDGSIKVSNTTGRDFDLTFVVLAVNGIGRATAIGYQHFPLKANTRDQDLPFGDTLSPGNYTVNVDVVGEEPQSKMIFRTRLVEPKMEISSGP